MVLRYRPVSLNSRGFTLIELMIAMVVILVAMLGLYQAIMVSMEGNVRNDLRDEGVRVAEEVINQIRELPYARIPVASPWSSLQFNAVLGYTPPIDRNVRLQSVSYQVVVYVTQSAPMKQVRVVAGWNHKGVVSTAGHVTGKEFEHSISTIVRSP